MNPWKPHVTVAAIIERQQQYLLVEERIDGQAVFNQPAGHLEAGESLLDAVRREVREETAHLFTPSALVGVYLYDVPGRPRGYLRFCFCGEVAEPALDQPLDDDIIACHWLSLAQIRQRPLRSPMVTRCIDDYLDGQRLPLTALHHLPA